MYTHRVQTGKRSYYFNVLRGPEGGAHLTVSQYARIGDEWIKLKIVVPGDEAKAFYQGLCDALRALRAAEGQKPAASASEAEAGPEGAAKPEEAQRETKGKQKAAA